MIIHVKVQEDLYRRDHMSGHTKKHEFTKLYRTEYRSCITGPAKISISKEFY